MEIETIFSGTALETGRVWIQFPAGKIPEECGSIARYGENY
jgi:hypothetical protein